MPSQTESAVRFEMDEQGWSGTRLHTAGSFDLAYLCTRPNFVVMAGRRADWCHGPPWHARQRGSRCASARQRARVALTEVPQACNRRAALSAGHDRRHPVARHADEEDEKGRHARAGTVDHHRRPTLRKTLDAALIRRLLTEA